MFSDEFLARHGSQSAFMYEPLKKLLEFTHIRMNPTRETIDAYLLRFNQERLLAELPDNATMAHLLLQGLTNTFKTRDETEEIALLSYRLEFPTGVSSFVNTRSPSYTPTYITVDDMELVEAPIVKKKVPLKFYNPLLHCATSFASGMDHPQRGSHHIQLPSINEFDSNLPSHAPVFRTTKKLESPTQDTLPKRCHSCQSSETPEWRKGPF
ncbi:hypothetical protein CU098_012010, partial [Rhizopus stolonifer]